jgi:hypothetical protein
MSLHPRTGDADIPHVRVSGVSGFSTDNDVGQPPPGRPGSWRRTLRGHLAITLFSLVAFTSVGCQLMPPPVGTAASVGPVTAAADDGRLPTDGWQYPKVCFDQWTSDKLGPITIEGGTGRKVAVIGDSLTTQARQPLIARGGFAWHISSYCGSRIVDWIPGGILAGALSTVRDFEPEAIVIALGTNDAMGSVPARESARALLAQLPDGVPVTWVLPARAGHGETDDSMVVIRGELSNLPDVTVIDWARSAHTPGNRIDDNTHVSWSGAVAYADILASGTRALTQN